MSSTIGTDIVSASAASSSQKSKGKNAAGEYVFSQLLEAEKETQKAKAANDAQVDTFSVRLGDRTFEIAGKAIDMTNIKATPIAELPEDQYQSILKGLERWRDSLSHKLENMTFPEMPDLSQSIAYQGYADITIGSQVIGTVNNQGFVTVYNNAQGSRITQALTDIDNQAARMGITGGPDLAQFRAEKIAQMLGAKVTMLPTALTQSQYNAAPKIDPLDYRPHVNLEALKKDPEYIRLQQQIQTLKAARAEYLAHKAGDTA